VDVIRTKPKARRGLRWGITLAVVTGVLVTATAGLSFLQPALPAVNASAVIVDGVQRGTLVKKIPGFGT